MKLSRGHLRLLVILVVVLNIMFVMSAMLMTFWILNTMNAAMEFLTNPFSLVLMMVLFVMCFTVTPICTFVCLLVLKSREK